MTLQPGAVGFDRAGDVYERARPSYPDAAVAHLVEALYLRSGTTLDVGAGTGKLTRLLTASGARVVALEPLAGMWRQLVAALPSVPVAAGVAEAIPLADGAVHAVTAGQAFHWFRVDDAVAELHRVLEPGGRLGLVWNRRDESVDWVRAFNDLLQPYEADTPREWRRAWEPGFFQTNLFTSLERAEFDHTHALDVDGLVERAGSVSFVAALPDEERAVLLERVRALGETLAAPIVMPYRTAVYWCTRR